MTDDTQSAEYTKLLNEVVTLRWKCGSQAAEIEALSQPTQSNLHKTQSAAKQLFAENANKSTGQERQPTQSDALVEALSEQLTDTEIEDALVSEGIHTWGPDGERFERMFAVVMRLRAALAKAEGQ
jgi:hypothetical protein